MAQTMRSLNSGKPCRERRTLVQYAMSKNLSFSVGEHFDGFIEAQVSEGRYSSASDVVRAALRLLEDQETRLAALRAALIEGEESGVSSRDVHDIWTEVKERNGIARG
jgi:antitoxin ParD1/3/4